MATHPLGVLTSAGAGARRHAPGAIAAGEHAVDRDRDALELALLRRSLAGLHHASERCGGCHRTLLLGERVYEYATGAVRCALCRDGERRDPDASHLVHGPAFGHTIRVLDRRRAS